MSDFEEEEEGHPMTKKDIKAAIKKHNQYNTPELNEVLYLHYYGFTKIQHLNAFVNLKALWLNNNAISTIEGLDELTNLACLYLANNLIEEITGLEKLENLDTLVLSSNYISKIDGLSGCKKLTTLSLDHNKLREPENLAGLIEAPSLTILNMNNNTIASEDFAEVIKPLTALRVLRMEGNEVTRKMKNYRRRITLLFPELRFLDDSPVTEDDRRLANAWSTGGLPAERVERDLIKKEKDDKHAENMRKFHELVEQGKKKYEEEHRNEQNNDENNDQNDDRNDENDEANQNAKIEEIANIEGKIEKAEGKVQIVQETSPETQNNNNTTENITEFKESQTTGKIVIHEDVIEDQKAPETNEEEENDNFFVTKQTTDVPVDVPVHEVKIPNENDTVEVNFGADDDSASGDNDDID